MIVEKYLEWKVVDQQAVICATPVLQVEGPVISNSCIIMLIYRGEASPNGVRQKNIVQEEQWMDRHESI